MEYCLAANRLGLATRLRLLEPRQWFRMLWMDVRYTLNCTESTNGLMQLFLPRDGMVGGLA